MGAMLAVRLGGCTGWQRSNTCTPLPDVQYYTSENRFTHSKVAMLRSHVQQLKMSTVATAILNVCKAAYPDKAPSAI